MEREVFESFKAGSASVAYKKNPDLITEVRKSDVYCFEEGSFF